MRHRELTSLTENVTTVRAEITGELGTAIDFTQQNNVLNSKIAELDYYYKYNLGDPL